MSDAYALFLFEAQEASGGVDDLKLIGSMNECISLAETSNHHYSSQIVLLPTLEVVKRGEWRCAADPIVGRPSTWNYEWVDEVAPSNS